MHGFDSLLRSSSKTEFNSERNSHISTMRHTMLQAFKNQSVHGLHMLNLSYYYFGRLVAILVRARCQSIFCMRCDTSLSTLTQFSRFFLLGTAGYGNTRNLSYLLLWFLPVSLSSFGRLVKCTHVKSTREQVFRFSPFGLAHPCHSLASCRY